MACHDDPTKVIVDSIDLDKFNTLSPKHSMCDTVDQRLSNGDPSALQHHLTSVVLNQMTSKAGVKNYGDKAREALFTEFLKLYYLNVFMPINKKDLTRQQTKSAIRSMSVIKEKRYDKLKGRTCDVGTPQLQI